MGAVVNDAAWWARRMTVWSLQVISLKRLIASVVVWVAAASAGCTSMRTIHPVTEPATPIFDSVKVGDTVVVQTRDGRRDRFVVRQIDGDAIVSEQGVRYTRADISQLQRRSVSTWKTVLLVGAAVYAAVYIMLLVVPE
jgi:uncharacterized lipoprotein YajG